jgi:hypothetical protein
MLSASLSLLDLDIGVGHQPEGLCFLLVFNLNCGQLLHQVEVDGQEQVDQLLPDVLGVPDDHMGFLSYSARTW